MRTADTQSIVRIYTKNRGSAGVGVLVSPNHVLTCTHVVAKALGLPENASLAEGAGPVRFDCALMPGPRLCREDAVVEKSNPAQDRRNPVPNPDPQADLTLLRFEQPLSEIRPAKFLVPRLVEALRGDEFEAYGFPPGHGEPLWGVGEIGGANATMVQLTRHLAKPFPEPGFSGGPIWDVQNEAFVGLLNAVDAARQAAFMIPASTLRKFFPALPAVDAREVLLEAEVVANLINLCDRDDQDKKIKKRFGDYKDSQPHHPFVCVVHGDDEQAVEDYLDRLRDLRIEKWLGDRPAVKHRISWSPELLRSGTPEQIRSHLEEHAREFKLHDPQNNAPAFVSAVLTSDFLRRRDLETQFVQFWETYQLGTTRPVLICLGVVYLAQRSWLPRFLGGDSKEQVQERIGALGERPNVRVTAPELQSVHRLEAMQWREREELRQHGVHVEPRKIKAIYDRSDATWPEGGPIAMDHLKPELEKLLAGGTT